MNTFNKLKKILRSFSKGFEVKFLHNFHEIIKKVNEILFKDLLKTLR